MIMIFHANQNLFRDSSCFGLGSLFTEADALKAFDANQYDFVGLAKTVDLDTAFQLSNHINHNWADNENVSVPYGVKPRSSSVGDIFVTNRQIFIVARAGFELLRDLDVIEIVRNARATA